LLDGGRVFSDPLALTILGPQRAAALREAGGRDASPIARAMRGPVAARSRIAEDTLAEAVAAGASQYVLLGAGLDTFACSNPWAGRVRVFELDHPASQAWKRRMLREAGLALPAGASLVPVDFAREDFITRLQAAGWDSSRPTVFAWLGVTMYLPEAAVLDCLRAIARHSARGSVLVFDFVRRPARLDLPRRALMAFLSRRFSAMGEPWLGLLDEDELDEQMRAMGFQAPEFLSASQLARQLLAGQVIPARHRSFGAMIGGIVRAHVGAALPAAGN
jgi:methyltransferase (TIGR00027 family)